MLPIMHFVWSLVGGGWNSSSSAVGMDSLVHSLNGIEWHVGGWIDELSGLHETRTPRTREQDMHASWVVNAARS